MRLSTGRAQADAEAGVEVVFAVEVVVVVVVVVVVITKNTKQKIVNTKNITIITIRKKNKLQVVAADIVITTMMKHQKTQ